MLHGALAAAVTPLDGDEVDERAFGPYVDFLADSGIDGLLALGTTGEGLLLDQAERRRVVELFLESAAGRLHVAAHCGAQTTADTVALAAHAAEAGVDAVAVIGPPYFPLDERALLEHFTAAAAAVLLPSTSTVRARERLRGAAAGPLQAAGTGVEPRRAEGLGRAVRALLAVPAGGPRRLRRPRGAHLRPGSPRAQRRAPFSASKRVSRAGSRRWLRSRTAAGAAELGELRAAIERLPRHAALKYALGFRGVPVREDVRRPLRQLTEGEREELRGWLGSS